MRSTRAMAVKRISELGDKFARAAHILKWDPVETEDEERLLIGSEDEVRVYIIGKWAGPGKEEGEQDGTILVGGRISNAVWLTGTIPTTNDEEPETVARIMVFGKDGVMGAQVWSADGVEVEVQGPKFSKVAGVITKGQETFFSVLCRPYTTDIINTYTLRKRGKKLQGVPFDSIVLSGVTLDAKSIKYSPSGRFIAILDTPVCGYAVHLLTTEFEDCERVIHSYYGPHYLKTPLGVNIIPAMTIEWLTVDNKEVLLVADQSETVSILSTLTFKPLATLKHFKGFVHRDLPVWSEDVSSPSGALIYSLASLPYSPLTTHTKGLSHLCVSPSGGYIATTVSSMPTTVWIWYVDATSPSFCDLIAVVSHTSLIKNLSFRSGPKSSAQLLITLSMCNFVGIWDSLDQQHPQILQFTDLASTGRFTANWATLAQSKPGYDIYACDGRSFVVYSTIGDTVGFKEEESFMIDPADDTNVLQIAEDVRLTDKGDLSDTEDTFVHEKKRKLNKLPSR